MQTNWTVAARSALGLDRHEKLPAGGRGPKGIGYGFRAAKLEPQGPELPRGRRMAHRLKVTCQHCGCWIGAGRLAQHEPACRQRDNG